ncbi:hypothetical protein N7478_001112 [Penicillium angulare]|uniref:uncharacterized protein n=1 Tax=Penicillium angulare TaxID=116970 RepID=UPI0025416CB5|nr:uncharacterized protein N7478_001112 [Penicillium angulare]KAJ5291861.1 hypothetical protein N7478_001112 [Penicillium angulare]
MSPFTTKRRSGLDELLNRKRLGPWEQFLEQPCVFLARKLYTWHQIIPAAPLTNPVFIVCISDHNTQPSLPDGDILIHAGDLTHSGSLHELQTTLTWLNAQAHAIKIVVAGNHDLLLDTGYHSNDHKLGASANQEVQVQLSERDQLDWSDIMYLENEEAPVICENGRHLRIYGSPHSPQNGNWAFQYPRSQDIWTTIVPGGIDVLITHGPPRGHLDLMKLGCMHLLRNLWRVQPRLHVFGHVHEGRGTEWLLFDELENAYERVIFAGGGLWCLLLTILVFLKTLFRPSVEARCLLVNATIVGGLREDERRQPIIFKGYPFSFIVLY